MAYTHILQKRTGIGTIDTSSWMMIAGYGADDYAAHAVVDSQAKLNFVGSTNGVIGNTDWAIGQINSSGVLQWQRALGYTPDDSIGGGNAVAMDDLENLYVVGRQDSGSGDQDLTVVKYNSSGTIQWQRKLYGAGTALDYGQGVDVNGTDLYVVGTTASEGEGGDDAILIKMNTSGSVQWQRVIGTSGSGVADRGYDVKIGSTGDVYIVVEGAVASTTLMKYNSSGTIQWQRKVAAQNGYHGLALDNSDNPITISRSYDTVSNLILTKYNSSGIQQWQRKVGIPAESLSSMNPRDVAVDDSDNIYVTGDRNGSFLQEAAYVLKYNSSGVLQWKTVIRDSTTANIIRGYGIVPGPSGILYVVGAHRINGQDDDMFFAKIKTDGTGLGTYGSTIIYETLTATDTAGSLSDTASSLVDTAGSLSDTASGMTDTAGLLSPTLYTLP